jgi:asparagine synthase (glutamine-hydrolysing)
MSGIVGIYYLDGRPVGCTDLERMVSRLAHRGPDGTGIWHGGPVGLGHRMLWTTPESLQEQCPLVSQSGDLGLTADAWVDNRDELVTALGLSDRLRGEITDSQLILAAYEKWGTSCPAKLLGDFAFAIWDRHNRRLFCARDHFGIRPFYYYYRPGYVFAFASEIKALLCLPEVPRRLNEARVADYLAPMLEDKTITFYQQIFRLPPAHSIIVSHGTILCQPYWSLDPSYELQLDSDEAYAGAFRELFTKAVHCRLRSAFPVGAHLSGGLDSSAITCVARERIGREADTGLHTFSIIFDDVPQCDERPYINAVLSQGGLIPHYVQADRLGPFADLERIFWHHDEPFFGPNHFLPWELNRAAQQEGVRIILDGFDGDTIVSHGAVYFAELTRKRQWKMFAEEAQAVSRHYDTSPPGLLRCYGLPYLEELARGWRWVAFATAVHQLRQHFHVSRRHLLLRYGLKSLVPTCMGQIWRALGRCRPSICGAEAIINPCFAQYIGLQERIRAFDGSQSGPPRTVREDQWRSLTSGLFTIMLEQLDRGAAAFALEARHPFMDKRLVEFCLALPPEQKLHQGWGRMVMRRAMAKVLPEQVQWRGGKTDMTPNFVYGLLTFDRELLDEVILHAPGIIERYVNIKALREVYRRMTTQPNVHADDAITVWRIVTLARWLLYTGLEP